MMSLTSPLVSDKGHSLNRGKKELMKKDKPGPDFETITRKFR